MQGKCDEGGDVPHARQGLLSSTTGLDGDGTILVPTDFKAESDYALQHAVRLAEAAATGVTLLRVLTEGETEAEALATMETQVARAGCGRFPVRCAVAEGQIPFAVQIAAEAFRAEYIVLGSHSIQQPATLKSSEARRILKYGNVPYITIQQPPRDEDIEHVVFPIDYTDGNRLKYGWLEPLCREYNPTFHLVTPDVNEPNLLQSVQENMARALGCIARIGAKHVEHQVEGRDEFSVEILEYAQAVGADLLVIASAPDPRQPGMYMLEPHERNLVVGGGATPVMVINPKESDL